MLDSVDVAAFWKDVFLKTVERADQLVPINKPALSDSHYSL